MTIITRTPRFGYPVYEHLTDYPWDADRWPDFGPHELACKGTRWLAVHPESLDMLQELRRVIGKPFYVVSGYRSPQYNASLNGTASRSYHMDAIAYDISMRNHNPHEFMARAVERGFDGIGQYPQSWNNFIHIDTRGSTARWGTPF